MHILITSFKDITDGLLLGDNGLTKTITEYLLMLFVFTL